MPSFDGSTRKRISYPISVTCNMLEGIHRRIYLVDGFLGFVEIRLDVVAPDFESTAKLVDDQLGIAPNKDGVAADVIVIHII